jgi:small subunit ribosomal protein S9
MYNSNPYFYGTGRRKSSVARVRVYPNGTGAITINDRDIDEYFGLDTLKLIVRQPMELTETIGAFDIVCTVAGGGVTGQAGAIRHGLSRALLQYNEELRPVLNNESFIAQPGNG